MSPDDIFAAQFWPWPDPAIKRDAQGRVLFVNAAFLALYGGQVESWRGNAVGGWPAPQAVGAAPYRFETRIPATDGSEQVYDWMEQTLTDGNAFAIARNVTMFTQAPEPDPAATMAPAETQFDPNAQMAAAPQQEPAYEAPVAQAETVDVEVPEQFAAPVQEVEAPAIEEAFAPQAEVQAAPIEQEAPVAVPEIAIPQIDIPSDENYALTDTSEPAPAPAPAPDAAQAPIESAPVASESADMTPPAAPQTTGEEREFERRALPIEDESAVLGNNWRDAVIAKAVGAEGVAAVVAEPEEEAAPAAEETAQAVEGGPIRILLAEDNAINALLTRTLLEAEGHNVDTVEDGLLAVEAMKTSTYDLIFMDMRMPNMDGLEATRKIRALPNVARSLPIVALTANAFDDDRNACFDSGMNDFMTKPVSAEELSEKVRDWTSPEAKERLAKAA